MTSETIVAVYDNTATAQQVVKDLESAGIAASAIQTYSNDQYDVGGTGSSTGGSGLITGGSTTTDRREGGFWTWLFGEDSGTTTTTTGSHAVYDQSLQRGGTVVTVIAQSSDTQRIMDILERHNPLDIEEHAASAGTAATATQTSATAGAATTGAGYTSAARTSQTTGQTTGREGDTMTLSEEQLVVGKREVERGTARLRKYVVSRPVEEQIRLREETVSVFRRPVTGTDRTVNDAFTDRTVEVREMAEEAVVGKTARVVEEVGLQKQVGERVETVRDTVRKEEVEVTGVNDRTRTGTAGTTEKTTTTTTGRTGTY